MKVLLPSVTSGLASCSGRTRACSSKRQDRITNSLFPPVKINMVIRQSSVCIPITPHTSQTAGGPRPGGRL